MKSKEILDKITAEIREVNYLAAVSDASLVCCSNSSSGQQLLSGAAYYRNSEFHGMHFLADFLFYNVVLYGILC